MDSIENGSGHGGFDYVPNEVPTTPGYDNKTNFSSSLLTFAAVMTFLIMIIGICGNFLTVVALLKCPKVRNVAAAFIISLCIADLLFCALVLPFQGIRFVQGQWQNSDVLCRLIPFIQYGNIGVSLLCIAMITINRYVMITHHSCYARIYKRHWIAIMIAACWLVSYGMQLPTLLGAWGYFGYDERLQTCSIMSDKYGHSSKTTLFITAFVIPCLVIIACYAKIFWVVHKSEQRLKRHANNQNNIPNNLRQSPGGGGGEMNPNGGGGSGAGGGGGAEAAAAAVSCDSSSSSYATEAAATAAATGKQLTTTRVKDQREVRTKRNEWRITKMVLAIFLSFVICYLPITIVKVADKDVQHPSLHIFSYIMLYLSACINPIIYVIMNKQYRKAYKTVVLCQPARLLLPFGAMKGGVGGGGGGGGGNGASSAAEKWKDTGLSNNHSRTIVSQMSGGGQSPCPSPSPTQSQSAGPLPLKQAMPSTPIALEMMPPRHTITPPATINSKVMEQPPPPPPPSVVTQKSPTMMMIQGSGGGAGALGVKRSNHSYINNGFNSSHNNHSNSSYSNPSLYRPEVGGKSNSGSTAAIRRITMVGDDIILEEEELPPPATPSPPPPSTTTITATTPKLKPMTMPKPTPIYMNVVSPKNSQFYSKTIDNIPANDSNGGSATKVTDKLKIQKD